MATASTQLKSDATHDSARIVHPEGWRYLRHVVPRGQRDQVGALIGRSGITVGRWTMPVIHGSGELSFLDTLFRFTAALKQVNPSGLRFLERTLSRWFRQLDEDGIGEYHPSRAAASITKEAAEAVCAILDGLPLDERERELMELETVIAEQLALIRAERRPRAVRAR